MNKNINIIGLIGTLILFLLVILSVEKNNIKTNFKIEKHPVEKIGYAITASENFNGNIDGIQGILENSNVLNDFCNPESLTFCAHPKPFKYEVDPELLKVPNRTWNPSKISGNQGPMGAGPISIPTMATTINLS
jgi:hypothetical protein